MKIRRHPFTAVVFCNFCCNCDVVGACFGSTDPKTLFAGRARSVLFQRGPVRAATVIRQGWAVSASRWRVGGDHSPGPPSFMRPRDCCQNRVAWNVPGEAEAVR